jgi:hypothetical protein
MKENQNESIPLAIALTIQELKGWVAKELFVPIGKRGIVILRNGKSKLYPPGTHTALNPLQRIKKQGVGLVAGFMPEKELPLFLRINNILTGDDHLVDISLMCQLEILDHKNFFETDVIPRKHLEGPALIMDDEESFRAVYQIINEYALEDLISGSLHDTIRQRISTLLQSILSLQGLELSNVFLLTIWPVEDRVRIEEKLLEFEQKMNSISLEKKMAMIENDAQLQEFMQEFGISLPKTSVFSKISLKPEESSASKSLFFDWIKSELKDNLPGRNFRIKSIWQKKIKPDTDEKTGRIQFFPRLVFIILIFLLILSVISLYAKIVNNETLSRDYRFYLSIGTILVGLIINTIIAYYKKWEADYATDYDDRRTSLLDDLSEKNRKEVDVIVRNQCVAELSEQKRMLNDARSRVYKNGEETLALTLKRLENKIDDSIDQIQNKNFGIPPYLNFNQKFTTRIWEEFLEKDEQILIMASSLTQVVLDIQKQIGQQTIDKGLISDFENQLDHFLQTFGARHRIFHNNEQEIVNHVVSELETKQGGE